MTPNVPNLHTTGPVAHRGAAAARRAGVPRTALAVTAAAVAALAVFGSTLGSAPAFAQPQLMPAIATADGEAPRHGRHGGKHAARPGAGAGAGMGAVAMGLPGLPLGPRMLDRVGATDEQKAQIEQIMQSARADLQAQREAGAATRGQARDLFAQPTVDARTAEALRRELMAQQDQASQRMMQAMVEASRVLTLEQRQALMQQAEQRRALMEQRRSEHMQRGERAARGERRPMGGGHGGGHGAGHGGHHGMTI